MSKPESQPPTPPPDWSAADDRAIDAWLGELFSRDDRAAQSHRRDADDRLANEVLTQLAQRWEAESQTSRRLPAIDGAAGQRGRLARYLVGAIGLAAAVLLAVALRRPAPEPSLAAVQSPANQSPAAQSAPRTGVAAIDTPAAAGGLATHQSPVVANRSDQSLVQPPVTLDRLPEAIAVATDDQAAAQNRADRMAPAPPSVRLAVATPSVDQFNQQFRQYWQAIGVEPAAELSPQQWQQRLEQRLGLTGDLPSLASPESDALSATIELVSTPQTSERLAQQLIVELSAGLPLSQQQHQKFAAEAAEVLRSGQRFDHWISSWAAAQWESAQQAAAALDDSDPRWSAELGHRGQWFAQQVLGADIGCARCHDSPINSRFSQDDYWSLAALLAPVDRPLFYELPDGRQRLAEPGLPQRWVSGQRESTGRLSTPQELASQLHGSRQLARSLVNQMWAVGFGEPLVGSASSPVSPPIDDSLEAALNLLTDGLLAADFDLRVVVAWMVHSAPMKRGVATELAGTSWQYAGEAELARASLAQRSFAAARLPWPTAQQPQLLAMMHSRQGVSTTRLDRLDRILAQPAITARPLTAELPTAGPSTAPQPQLSVNNEDYWWTQWLADRQAIRGGWLESIRDRDQKLRHAFYAAGIPDIDPAQWQAVQSLLPADEPNGSPDDAVSQAFWIIHQTR